MLGSRHTYDRVDRVRKNLSSGQAQVWPWVLAAVVMIALLAAWRWTPLSEYAEPERLEQWIEGYLTWPWGPLVLVIAYCMANLIIFPNMMLNLAVILALGPWIGVPAALGGTLVAGFAAFFLGAQFGRGRVERIENDKISDALEMVRQSGMPGMILLRMIPVAPYPIVNVALGASNVDGWTFLVGSAIGIFPSLVAMGAFGLSFDSILEDPGVKDALMVGAIIGSYLLLIQWLRRTLRARVAESGGNPSSDC